MSDDNYGVDALVVDLLRYLSDHPTLAPFFAQPADVLPIETRYGYEQYAPWVNVAARLVADEDKERLRVEGGFETIEQAVEHAAYNTTYTMTRDLEEMIVKALPGLIRELVEIREQR